MPTVVEVPGVGEVEFPDSMTRKQIESQVKQLIQPQPTPLQTSVPGPSVSGVINRGGQFPGGALEPPPTPPQLDTAGSIGDRFASRFISDVIGIPSGLGELLSIGAGGVQAGARSVGNLATGQPANFGAEFAQARQEQSQQFPASLLMRSPSPSPEQVAAFAKTVGRAPQVMTGPETFSSEFQRQLQLQQQAAEHHPIQTMIGDAGGDIAALLAARPVTRRLFPAARSAPAAQRESVDIIDSAANRLTNATGFAKRLGAQAGEAGFEGALLAAIGDSDPLATAGWAAGTQAGGSLALHGTKAFVKYPWRTLGGLAMAHWVYRALAPGGQGALEDVRDETVQAMLTTFGLGTLATLAGAGRLAPGKTAGRDRFIDAFDTLRRAPIISVINQLNEAEQAGDDRLGRIIGKIAEDPDFFGREARIRMERASRSEKPNALIREVDSLMRSARFQKRYDEL